MISADLMIDKINSTSSMRTGSKICLYPSTTSIAVSTSSAPQTQKYCALLSCPEYSSLAASCIVEVLAQFKIGLHPTILVDSKYTSGKMNIHTRSTKCQYSPATSTSCAS